MVTLAVCGVFTLLRKCGKRRRDEGREEVQTSPDLKQINAA